MTQAKLKYSLLVLGLDNAGKSRAIMRLQGDHSEPPFGAWGFSSSTLLLRLPTMCCLWPFYKKRSVTFFDVGGHAKIRKIWPSYFSDVFGVIFVIDSASPERFEEARVELHQICQSDTMKGKPVLILANRMLLSIKELTSILDLRGLKNSLNMGGSTLEIHITRCNLDNKCHEGINWLMWSIDRKFSTLASRVLKDVSDQAEEFDRKRSKRVYPSNDQLSDC